MLEGIALFAGLSKRDLAVLEPMCAVRSYPKNSLLIHEGERGDALYLLLSGRVKVFRSGESGQEFILGFQEPGEVFGELGLLDDRPRSASVITVVESRLAMIVKESFRQCLERYPDVALRLIVSLVQRVRILTENLHNMALLSVQNRVANTLISFARGDAEQDRWELEPRLTHQDIANMVGASREMVSRVMREFAKNEAIEVNQGRIIVRRKLLQELYNCHSALDEVGATDLAADGNR